MTNSIDIRLTGNPELIQAAVAILEYCLGDLVHLGEPHKSTREKYAGSALARGTLKIPTSQEEAARYEAQIRPYNGQIIAATVSAAPPAKPARQRQARQVPAAATGKTRRLASTGATKKLSRAPARKKKPPGRRLHRITTLTLTRVDTERGGKWRLLRGKTILWSKPATGPNAISHQDIIAKSRGYLISHGYQRLIDATGAKVE